jgi:hypothetical protein
VAELTYTETLVTTSCWCGIHLAVPDNLLRWAKQSQRNSIYCPIGHTFVFGDSFEEKYRQEQERRAAAERRAQATRDLLAAEERSHSATRGHLTRTKKRVAHGVCPCCNRTFQQLSRHMASRHPEYVQEAAKS